ncbi:unnamed protein product [Peniophora sp. CBMAI 1063]|nr:unnamed protein product [Peniophora sp. CBMAI 1063]
MSVFRIGTAHDLCRRAALGRWALGLGQGRRAMSVRPAANAFDHTQPPRKKVTIRHLQQLHAAGTPISMLTAYDYPTALALDAQGVDVTLVGDSLAQVCLGYSSTTQLTLDEMLHHCRAVARGTTHPLLMVDMPFGSYHTGLDDAARAAVRLMQEGRAEAVKIEGGAEIVPIVERLTQIGVPVMAHIGLMPQRHVALSGYRVQGQTGQSALNLYRDALRLQEAGAFSFLIEAVPAKLGEFLTEKLRVPTVGIGAGRGTSGQVLVWDDAMGRWSGKKAKFVRRFAEVGREEARGVRAYVAAVRGGSFPDNETEGYGIQPTEWAHFLDLVQEKGWKSASERAMDSGELDDLPDVVEAAKATA